MTDAKFNFWQKWLTWANVMTVLVGLLVAFAGNSIFFDAYNSFTNELFFQGNEMQGELLNFKNWLFGIIGGTIVGFHVLMIMISENAFKKKESWANKTLWLGLLSWFIVDSSITIYYGALHNMVMINSVALVLIGLPLIMTRKAFKS
ncbi:hypothetical protein FEE95_01195 [Maribacter algarum]|uniref:Uncharacterized protein n=1 Tax=Maribacter algarum (ex Zhang et al. 2020) TaxID=2578118 RepID=A0A5S3PSV7_9FLAO|nr:hypothetical protein [Maribacter algarum]TMM58071.1 hypothetical protein FEE95_01195 [Maribacter algarum]